MDRRWEDGEQIELEFQMSIDRLKAHPEVRADTGRVALRRGPLIYCLEGVDNPEPLDHILVCDDGLEATHRPEMLEGITTIEGTAQYVPSEEWEGKLYKRQSDVDKIKVNIVAVPYYVWENRAPGEMLVWMRES